ncbi:MAG: zinc ABC transporter substrate-binding protein, partial [Planctomycetota bacterium]
GIVGCQRQADGTSKPPAGDNPRVVATVGMVADLVRQVGGDQIEVVSMCGSGVDPHSYQITRDDMQNLLQADAVFYSGLMLEGRMQKQLEQLANSKPVRAITDGLAKDDLLFNEPDKNLPDPHVWMDVSLWEKTLPVIVQTLSQLRPAAAETFQANATELQQKMRALDEYAKQTVASIPESRRLLVTSHDAFRYFGRAYGLEVQGVQGISTDSEAGLKRINELVDRLVDDQVPAVFVESSVSPKNMNALIEGAASRGLTVKRGGELFSDAMGRQGTYEGTYIGMIDHNTTLVARALGGDVPPGGMRQWLAEKGKQTGAEVESANPDPSQVETSASPAGTRG